MHQLPATLNAVDGGNRRDDGGWNDPRRTARERATQHSAGPHHVRGEAAPLVAAGRQTIAADPAITLDYFEIVDPETLEAMTVITKPALAAVAVFIGNTRLIDNALLEP